MSLITHTPADGDATHRTPGHHRTKAHNKTNFIGGREIAARNALRKCESETRMEHTKAIAEDEFF